MNILVDIRLLGRGGLSGIHEYTRQIVSHLLELDTKNHYQLFHNSWHKNPLPETWTRKENVAAINWNFPNRILDAGARFFNSPKIDKLVNADLVFSPHFNILATRDKPRLITIHDLSFLHHPYFFSGRQKLWQWFQNLPKQIRQAEGIIADSEFTKA